MERLADVKCGLVKVEMERPPTTATSTESRFRTGGGGCWRNRLWDGWPAAGVDERRAAAKNLRIGRMSGCGCEKLEWNELMFPLGF
ncbi:unnamed protein product [Linum trigynum]|uniref:Uncharacterized protein n=1 Tax=Linum trigynum TaxID=586398 RepID=A0AAV2FHV5_9ROSI